MILIIVIAISLWVPSEAFESPCPTWSSWSDERGHMSYSSNQALHPTMYALMGRRSMDMLCDDVKNTVETAAKASKVSWAGRNGPVEWSVKNFEVSKVAVEDVVVTVPSLYKMDFTLKNSDIYLRYELDTVGERYTVTANYKFSSLNPRFHAVHENGIFDMDLFWCKLSSVTPTVHLQAGTPEVLQNLFGNGKSKDVEIRKNLQNKICEGINSRAQHLLKKYFSDEHIQPVHDNINMFYPMWYWWMQNGKLQFYHLAWTQLDSPKTTPGFRYLQAGKWRQLINKHRLTGMPTQNTYLCHDDRFMIHYGFTDYFFEDFLAELFDKNLINFSTKTAKDPDLLSQLQLSSSDESLGKLMPKLVEKYPNGVVEFSYTIKNPPTLSIKNGWFDFYLNDGLLGVSINDNVTHQTLLWLGTFDVDYNIWCVPTIKANRFHVQFLPRNHGIKLELKNVMYVPDSELVTTAIKMSVNKFLVEQVNRVAEPGFPIPNLKNTRLVNATLTSLEYDLIEVSGDLELATGNVENNID